MLGSILFNADNNTPLTFARVAESVYYNPRVTTRSLECSQSRIAGNLHAASLRRDGKKHVDAEEDEENEDGPAGRWMGLGGPLLRPRRQLPHPGHRQVLRRALRRVSARLQGILHGGLLDAGVMLLSVQLVR